MLFVRKPAYPVNRGYANFQKNSMDMNYPEPKDMYHCHPYIWKFTNTQSISPCGSFRYSTLKHDKKVGKACKDVGYDTKEV